MSVEIITEDRGRYSVSVLACNTSDTAFGPLMHNTKDEVREFLAWLGVDPRRLDESDLVGRYYEWQGLSDDGSET